MRCYFMKNGHIASVQILDGCTEAEAAEKSRALFATVSDKFEGFEVWNGAKPLLRHDKKTGDSVPQSG